MHGNLRIIYDNSRLKEITMKKYIIPALRVADIQNETILVYSLGVDPGQHTTTMDARRRAHRGRQNYDDVDIYYEEEDEDF